MKDKSVEAAWKRAKRERILEGGFALFSERGIEPVTMPEVAAASGVPRSTIYRYYMTKPELVVAIGAWKWESYIAEYMGTRPQEEIDRFTAAQLLRFFLDAFIDLYRSHKDILRFNYYFNSSWRNDPATPEEKRAYVSIVERM